MHVTEIVRQKLAALRIHGRHFSEFLGNSETWHPAVREAWHGDRARVAMGPADQIMSVLPASAESMPDFAAFQNELRGYNEVVRYPLYSAKAYATAGQLQLTFFDQSEGQATLGRADTNMQAGGQLPGNQMHVAHSLRMLWIPSYADVQLAGVVGPVAAGEAIRALTEGVWAEVTISDKIYLIAAPLTLLPAGCGPGTMVANPGIATALGFSYANNGLPSNDAIYRLDPPLGILPTRTFSVTANWKALKTVTTAARMMAILDGWRLRSVQ